MGSPENVAGMARYGIVGDDPYGISVADLRKLAKECGKDHGLALELWRSGRHEARILATLVDEPSRVTKAQVRAWARDLKSWDVTDACGYALFDKTPFAADIIHELASRKHEFTKRLAFSTLAGLAVHDKEASDASFTAFFPIMEREAGDERNFVKKAVSWSLRGIGKRNERLRQAALGCARRIAKQDTPGARWVASDVIRELEAR